MTELHPRVGVGVWIVHDNKVLVSFRVKPHGGGTWAAPGGHLEMNETWEECAKREALEETGLEVEDAQLFAVTNDIFPETGKHYITLHMQARSKSAHFTNNEPEKYQDLQWCAWNELPQPLFTSSHNLVKANQKPGYLL